MSVIECCLDDCLYAGNIIILVCDVKLCVPSYHSPNPAVVGTESNTVTPDWACLPLGYGSKLGGTVDARICWDVDKRLEDTNIAVAQMIVEFSQNRSAPYNSIF
jgi:hypothetical protein